MNIESESGLGEGQIGPSVEGGLGAEKETNNGEVIEEGLGGEEGNLLPKGSETRSSEQEPDTYIKNRDIAEFIARGAEDEIQKLMEYKELVRGLYGDELPTHIQQLIAEKERDVDRSTEHYEKMAILFRDWLARAFPSLTIMNGYDSGLINLYGIDGVVEKLKDFLLFTGYTDKFSITAQGSTINIYYKK